MTPRADRADWERLGKRGRWLGGGPHTKSRVRGAALGYLYAPLAECVVPALELGSQGGRRGGRRGVPKKLRPSAFKPPPPGPPATPPPHCEPVIGVGGGAR